MRQWDPTSSNLAALLIEAYGLTGVETKAVPTLWLTTLPARLSETSAASQARPHPTELISRPVLGQWQQTPPQWYQKSQKRDHAQGLENTAGSSPQLEDLKNLNPRLAQNALHLTTAHPALNLQPLKRG